MKEATKKTTLIRLRGGARNDQTMNMIDRAVDNGKIHGINLHPGVENLGNGNCAFECVLDSINTRECFLEKFKGTPEYWRKVWMTEIEKIAFEEWKGTRSKVEWHEGWSVLKESGAYEYELGDLVLPGIAHCTKKDILIFNTSQNAHSPIYVV